MSEAISPAGSAVEERRRVLPGAADLLRVARPGLMVSHLWLYLLPCVERAPAPDPGFWMGLLYVTVPLGLLIYGWNDYFDRDVDRISRRKNEPLTARVFGSRLGAARLDSLPPIIVAVQVPFIVFWVAAGHVELLGWLALMALANALYNGPGLRRSGLLGPGLRLSRRPVLAELTATGIYLLILWLGVLVYAPGLSFWLWILAALAILSFQVLGTLVDREADARVGKRTICVALGRPACLGLVVLFQLVKTGLSWTFTGSLAASLVLLAAAALLLAGVSGPRWSRSGTGYAAFIVLDWVWLLLVLAR